LIHSRRDGAEEGSVSESWRYSVAYPHDGRVMPQDLFATIFHCLGIRPDAEYQDAQGRPIPLCRGDVVRQVV